MIGKLSGRLERQDETSALVDVNGVGYIAFCSGRTLRALPRVGEPVQLLIETQVRQDHIHLFGFLEAAEQYWFNLLQTVQGVGARVALAILSTLAPGELAEAIAAQDKTALTRADGVGPKLAVRLITELKDKVKGLPVAASGAGLRMPDDVKGNAADAVSALVHLGYKRADAYVAVVKAGRELGADADVRILISTSLQELAR